MSDPNLPEGVTQDDIDMYDEPSPLTTGEEESKELISKEEILLTKILADTEKMKNRIRWLDENSPMTKLIVGT